MHFTKNTIPDFPPLVKGLGALLYDVNNKLYIDFCSQTLNLNLGQCHPVILEAVSQQMQKLVCVSSRFSSDIALELHQKLVEITPNSLTKVCLSSVTGSLSIEFALKSVRKKTNKTKFIAFDRSHHGLSTEAMRVGGKNKNQTFLGERNCFHVPSPYCYRCPVGKNRANCNAECLDELETLVKINQGIAGVLVEPIMVDGGVLAPPQVFHERLRSICDNYYLALIWDEVQTAFGWMGNMFAMDYYSVIPDIVCLSKGLGAGFPLAATIIKEEFDVLDYGEHEMTAGANVISCAASLAMIKLIESTNILSEVRRKGRKLSEGLKNLSKIFRSIGNVRGIGLVIGIEFIYERSQGPNPQLANAMFHELILCGYITRQSKTLMNGHIIQLKPPIVIEDEQIDDFLLIFEKILKKVLKYD